MYKQKIIDFFNEVKGTRLITKRHGDQILGNAFEDYMNVSENNNRNADYHGIEFKTKSNSSRSMITLFTQAPENVENYNPRLLELFGYDEHGTGIKKLNSTVSIKGTYNSKARKFFYLTIDEDLNKLYLRIKNDKNSEVVLPFYQIWDLSIFTDAVINKLSHIAYVSGDTVISDDGNNYVIFKKLEFFTGLTPDKLIEALKNNKLKLDIRLGAYESGRNIGKFHDHGTGFRITYKNLLKFIDVDTYE